MTGANAIAICDSPRGMPPANFNALSEFLAQRRKEDRERKPTNVLSAIPEDQQKELKALIEGIRSIDFFKPDGQPHGRRPQPSDQKWTAQPLKPGWKMFYGATWEEAWQAMELEVRRIAPRVVFGREENKAAILNAIKLIGKQNPAKTLKGAHGDKTTDVSTALDEALRKAGREKAGEYAHVTAATEVLSAILMPCRAAGFAALTTVANDAAHDATLFARAIVARDLQFRGKKSAIAYAEAYWEVWQKGYAMHCDLKGELYVCCRGSPPEGGE